MILYRKGGDTSARNVGDLLKAASLSSDDVTCAGVRNDAGHGEPVCRQHSLREVLSKGECKGDGIRRYRRDARGVRRPCSYALTLARGPPSLLGGRWWSCNAGARLALKLHNPSQKAADLTNESGDCSGEGLEICGRGGGH